MGDEEGTRPESLALFERGVVGGGRSSSKGSGSTRRRLIALGSLPAGLVFFDPSLSHGSRRGMAVKVQEFVRS